MSNYVIFTDSGCDLAPELLDQWGVLWTSLTFYFTDDEIEHTSTDMSAADFYERMRAGGNAKTSAISIGTFVDVFEPLLQEGKDVLHLSFSSGLSTTCNSARLAADQLAEQYPERKVVVVDTLCASAGQGLLLYHAKELKAQGKTIEEVAACLEKMKLSLCHWVTVDDLEYLKRGGRISPTVAFLGNALGLKPQIHVDNEGKLVSVAKIRGRKKAIVSLADKYDELALTPREGTVFISHADSAEDAKQLADILRERHGITVHTITDIGPVIGAHAGPGTVALFFLGRER